LHPGSTSKTEKIFGKNLIFFPIGFKNVDLI